MELCSRWRLILSASEVCQPVPRLTVLTTLAGDAHDLVDSSDPVPASAFLVSGISLRPSRNDAGYCRSRSTALIECR